MDGHASQNGFDWSAGDKEVACEPNDVAVASEFRIGMA